MIAVYAQWQREIMAALQGDFEEELQRMSIDRPIDRPRLLDAYAPSEAPNLAVRHGLEPDQ
jgi:hypothetical protein